MMRGSTTEEFESFLAAHAPIRHRTSFVDGECVGEWRITAFLGKGGSGEVYRAERATSGDGTSWTDETNGTEVAALKVLVKEGDAARARFQREIDLLSKNWHAAFPRFLGAGVVGSRVPRDRNHSETKETLIRDCGCEGTRDPTIAGRPYYAMELLAPVELPSAEADIAAFILAVSRAVAILHRSGLVHRDIKPQNIMRRANGDLVLIDLGLVKESSASDSPSGTSVTLVDGKVVGVGTPRYAAPEQFNGGAVSPATDIHALGMLANECFGGRPPRAWERIISRSTSSIPERRYGDIDAFTQAIRHRHYGRIVIWCGIAMTILAIAVVIMSEAVSKPVDAIVSIASKAKDPSSFDAFGTNASTVPGGFATLRSLDFDLQTNIVERQLLYEKFTTNDFGRVMLSERVWRNVTNSVAGTVIRLNNQRHSFAAPMLLETNRVYWIVGPGTLDVPLNGKPGAKVYLDNCVLINRTTNAVAASGIRYVFCKGSYLNFINLDRNEQSGYNAYMEDFDGAYNALEFEGPETLKVLLKRRADESRRLIELENR